MFNSPLNKTTQELVQAARSATTDYLTNGTDLTQAVVKVASKMQPITSEHVRRICEMTYHDAYERSFAEKTGMHQYVSFDPPDAILAAEALDAIQLGANQQQVFDKLASKKEAGAPMNTRNRLYSLFTKLAMTSQEVKAENKRIGRELKQISAALKNSPNDPALLKKKEELNAAQRALPNVKDLRAKEQAAAAAAASAQAEAENTKGGPGVFGEDKRKQDAQIAAEKLKEQAQPAEAPDVDKNVLKNVDEVAEGADEAADVTKKTKGFFGNMSGRNKMLLGGAGALGLGALSYGAYRAGQNNAPAQPQPMQQKVASLPKKFKPMNAFDVHISAAPGEKLADHNPTRELQHVHRDLRDSISTVKSELYAAEHNEKLAMIDMVKQAKAGLSAGHSMEQVLYAAVSVVDATEPFMAKTAHDLCATIAQACGKHQNFSKTAAALQEVNPNHPIPQKFKKLAEANIQRKHLEVTLDELNRNMDYFNEQLKNELFR